MVDSIGDENVAVDRSGWRNGAEGLSRRTRPKWRCDRYPSSASEIRPENAIPGPKRMHDISKSIQLQSAKIMPGPPHEVLKSLLQTS